MIGGMADTPVAARCEQCGQTDDHHKVHFLFGRTVHVDCMSAGERDMYGQPDASYGPDPHAILEAAQSGTHGADLRPLTIEGEAK